MFEMLSVWLCDHHTSIVCYDPDVKREENHTLHNNKHALDIYIYISQKNDLH